MRFLVTGTDISGRIVLRRETAEAARKKAAEMAVDGCHDISITAPDGQRYPPHAFDQLPPDGWLRNTAPSEYGLTKEDKTNRCS